jgi:hypothetical protein
VQPDKGERRSGRPSFTGARRSLKDLRDKAEGLEKYAKAAKHFESELRAMDIRLRASVRAGALIAEGQKNGSIATSKDGGRPNVSTTPTLFQAKGKPKTTLSELGISRDQSSQWQQLAGIPLKDLEEQLPVNTGKRTSPEKIIKPTRPKPDPVQLRRQKLATLALCIWGRILVQT